MTVDITRRSFVKASAAAAVLGAASAAQAQAPSERIRVGVIGTGNRGGQLIEPLLKQADAEIVALCDVYQPHLDTWAAKVGGDPKTFTDWRRLVDLHDVDAVVIATPDHWHALQTIAACRAGKDVYIEKPLAMTVVEGRAIVKVAEETKRIVQTGLHRRSSNTLADLRTAVQAGAAGKITVSQAHRISNMAPAGIGRAAHADPPADLDWDMWLGPRAKRPYQDNIAPYKFRWWRDYSSQLANWGVHYFDAIRWMLDEDAPRAVSCHGGVYAVDDDRTIPDTLFATFELAKGGLLLFGQYEASGVRAIPGEMEMRGTLGCIHYSARGYEIVPEKGGQFQDPAPRIEPVKVESADGDHTEAHIRNWLDCVKSRQQPNCDAVEGHKSTVFAHLASIALATESRVVWDPKTETIPNNPAANDLLHYEYRAPWKLDA